MDFREMQVKLYKLGRVTYTTAEIKKEIRQLEADCQSLREPKSVVIDDMPHSKTVSDAIGEKVVKIIDIYEKRIDELTSRLADDMAERDKLQGLIAKLSKDEQAVIKAKYIDGLRWEFIPGRVNISRRNCFYLHKRSVCKLINLWN